MPFQAWIPPAAAPRPHPQLGRFNGAMPFQAWIPGPADTTCRLPVPLQWGHALSGMDTSLAIPFAIEQWMLQWGHALSGMDTARARFILIRYIQASMGPCPFRHGYPAVGRCRWRVIQGFNGAMPFQAWIHRNPRCSNSKRRRCFNGAMPFQAWIPECRPQTATGHGGFNGAMPFQAWILNHLADR